MLFKNSCKDSSYIESNHAGRERLGAFGITAILLHFLHFVKCIFHESGHIFHGKTYTRLYVMPNKKPHYEKISLFLPDFLLGNFVKFLESTSSHLHRGDKISATREIAQLATRFKKLGASGDNMWIFEFQDFPSSVFEDKCLIVFGPTDDSCVISIMQQHVQWFQSLEHAPKLPRAYRKDWQQFATNDDESADFGDDYYYDQACEQEYEARSSCSSSPCNVHEINEEDEEEYYYDSHPFELHRARHSHSSKKPHKKKRGSKLSKKYRRESKVLSEQQEDLLRLAY